MADRIHIDQSNDDVVEALSSRETAAGVFSDNAHVAVFAAALGYAKGRFEPVREQGKAVLLPQLNKVPGPGHQDDTLDVFAVAHGGSLDVLDENATDDEADESSPSRTEVFEGYANGGLAYIKSRPYAGLPPLELMRRLFAMEFPEEDRDDELVHAALDRE